MDRRSFIIQTSLATGGFMLLPSLTACTADSGKTEPADLYELFQNPDSAYHPFVRWWWNGNKR